MSAPHDFAPACTAIFRAVLQASWQGSLAIGLVLLVRRLLGAALPARWQHLLWFLVLVRLLVPSVVLPRSRVSLQNIPAVAHPFARSLAGAEREPRPSEPKLATLPPSVRTAAGATASRPVPVPASAAAPSTWSPWLWAAWAWLGGLLVLTGRLLAGAVGLQRRLRRGALPVDESILLVWRACCRRWLRRPPPRVLLADWVDSPALVGCWRPTLLIPPRALAIFSAEDWEHVFAHEIAHLRWRDHWSQLLLLAAGCVHWFNPVVWLGLRQLRADRELAADEWVLRQLDQARALAYGETLFKTLADRPARLVFLPGGVGISEDGTQMKQRLRRIAAFLPRRRFSGSLLGLAVVVGLGTVVLGQGTPAPVVAPSAASPAATAVPAASPAAPSVASLAAEAQKFSDALLAAARAGNASEVARLIDASFTPRPAKLSQGAATAMLDSLLGARDFGAFTVLHDQLTQTNYARTWQPNDGLLAALVKDGRTDFLDYLLAHRLDPKRLAKAAKSADASTAGWIARRVEEVAKQHADVEALEKAAEKGDVPAMQALIDGGADVNGVGHDDNTPLLRAVFKNQVEAAQWLLDHGAQVNKPRLPGWNYTPLCLVKSVPMAELLKEHGGDIHAKLFRREVSILTYVAEWAPADVVAWFLQQGLDPKMVGDNDENLLFGLKDVQTARLLLAAGVDPNHVNKFGNTPICSASSAEVAQTLIDHGAKVTGFKEPLLPRMIQFGSGGAVEVVLKAGAEHDPELMQEMLIEAAHMDRDEIAAVLIKYGAKPNEPGIFSSKTDLLLPLQACCIWGGAKTAKVLLAAGADPNGGKTPGVLLKNAMGNGYKDVAKLLHDAGAKGVSDLAFALAMHDTGQVEKLLASAPTYTDNPVFWEDALPDAARVGDVATVRAALAQGVPVDAKKPAPGSSDAYTAAAEEGQDEVLAILLAQRPPAADPEDLRWATWEAVWNCHPYDKQHSAEHFEKCLELLLSAHAPLAGYQRSDGMMDLMTTAVFSRNPGGNPKVMEMLARAGVDPNPLGMEKDKPGKHLLEYVQEACAQGSCSTPVAETLVQLNHLSPTSGAPPAASPPPSSLDHGTTPAAPDAPPAAHQSFGNQGRVVMADGSPLRADPITAYTAYRTAAGGNGGGEQGVRGGVFYLSFPSDAPAATTLLTVAIAQAGCAVAFEGPVSLEKLDQRGSLEIGLTQGYTASLQVMDGAGRPIPSALLRPYYAGPPEVDIEYARTDAAGQVTLAHLGAAPLNIRVLADGFAGDEVTGLLLDPAHPYRWTLQPTPPLPGKVTSAATGKPIAGATIKLAGVRGPQQEIHDDPKQAPVLTTTDARGEFVLTSLRPDSHYYLFVEAPGYGGAYLRGVALAAGSAHVALGPELLIRGKIIHAPPSVVHLGKIHLQFGQSFAFGESYAAEKEEKVDLTPVDGTADFSVGPFYKVYGEFFDPEKPSWNWDRKPIGLYVDTWGRADFNVDQLPIANFVFDLATATDTRAPKPASSPADHGTR